MQSTLTTGPKIRDHLYALWSTTLSDVIQNTSDIEHLQDDAFITYDRIGGTDADDEVSGDDDNDLLIGFAGNDTISGGGGDDYIIGGIGNDTLTGGDGLDRFAFDASDGADVITDFNAAEDRISIDVEDTDIDISALFLSVEGGGFDINLGEGNRIFVAGDDTLEEDDLAAAIDLI